MSMLLCYVYLWLYAHTLKAMVNELRMLWDPIAQVTFIDGQVHFIQILYTV